MKVAIIDKVHPLISEDFNKIGWKCDNLFEKTREELKLIIDSYDGIILRSRIKMDEDFLVNASKLKFIGRPGAGLENIDTEYCKKKGISVFRSPEGNRDAVAEHILGMLLSLFNNIKDADLQVRKGIWLREENRGVELMGKTVGIIGYGYMGRAFAKRLKGFGVRVMAYDKYISGFGDELCEEATLEMVFENSDIVSIHTPLTKETIGMVDEKFINNFKKPIYFINSARGKSVITSAIVTAIEYGKIKGACLDVSEYESSTFMKLDTEEVPEPLKYLLESDKVLLTPHIAGWTHEAKLKMAQHLSAKILSEFN